LAPKKADKEKTETKKKARTATSSKKNNKNNTSSSRVKKNKILYNNKIVIKNNKISNTLIAVLVMSLAVNTFTIYHFLTFNHNKVKTVTKVKKIEVPTENIVFLGDSITHQYDLEKYYGNNLPIVNSGEDGDTTNDVLKNIKNRLHNYHPTTVFLLIGTNDIPYVEEDEIFKKIKAIIENTKERSPTCKIYLESVYPVNDTDDEKINHSMVKKRDNKKIMNLNKKLESYAKDNNNVTYINIYDKLTDKNGNLNIEYTRDGLHLSEKGYEIVTENLKKYIKKR